MYGHVLLVIAGYAGGSWYGDHGGASNYVCLSSDPLWGKYNDAVTGYAKMYGGEFQDEADGDLLFGEHLHNQDPTCSVCHTTTRASTLMIPGRNRCYPGWHLEYSGYLMAGNHDQESASEYICMDARPETLQHSVQNEDGRLFRLVEGHCGSLPCPPYVDGRELTCVVCSK
jgi:hypothetical protein